jgi:hypothetical protein
MEGLVRDLFGIEQKESLKARARGKNGRVGMDMVVPGKNGNTGAGCVVCPEQRGLVGQVGQNWREPMQADKGEKGG